MKNISEKIETYRTATAVCTVRMHPESIARILKNDLPKVDVLPISRAAAVLAAKKTQELLPYCHPLPIDVVDVKFDLGADTIVVTATVTAIWKTGVEMEALMAANIAALNIYDMIKPIDKNLTLERCELVKKTGGKSDYVETLPKNFKAAVIVTSDGTYAKKREDRSGKILSERLHSLGVENVQYFVLPDEKIQIRNLLLELCEKNTNLILTTGGTGLGPRDVTVEATSEVLEREMPGVMSAIHTYGQKRTPYAMLSRGLAGSRGSSIIVNLPGSTRGATEGLNAVFPALFHVYKMMAGGGHVG